MNSVGTLTGDFGIFSVCLAEVESTGAPFSLLTCVADVESGGGASFSFLSCLAGVETVGASLSLWTCLVDTEPAKMMNRPFRNSTGNWGEFQIVINR